MLFISKIITVMIRLIMPITTIIKITSYFLTDL